MPTKRQRRTRNMRRVVSDVMRRFLLTGQYRGCGLEPFTKGRQDMRADWRAIEAEVLAEWVAAHPGTRPWAWWEFSEPGALSDDDTEAAYLQRRGLLTAGEARRLPPGRLFETRAHWARVTEETPRHE